MSKIFFLIIFLSVFKTFAVQKTEKTARVEYKIIKSESVIIPVEIKSIIDMQMKGPDVKEKETPLRENLPVEFTISYQNGDKEFITNILTPHGQSKLNLYNYIDKKARDIKIRVSIKTENLSLDGLRVFFKSFMSQDGKDSKTCHKLLDITSFYNKVLSKGVTLSMSENQYLRVLAGQFFFVISQKDKLHIAGVEVGHSRLSHKFDCY